MKADEFIALVEQRGPLLNNYGPYACADGTPLPIMRDDDDSCERFTADCDTFGKLADAAPALAAAAILALREWAKQNSDGCPLCGHDRDGLTRTFRHDAGCKWAALRAALPEALRE